jgi:hypothetical protein
MSTFCLSGFRQRDVFTQRTKDAVGIIVDADSPRAAVEIAKKILGPMACLFDGQEIESAPDERKRRLLPLVQIEACVVHKTDGLDFMIR